jgi:hypothetical protein
VLQLNAGESWEGQVVIEEKGERGERVDAVLLWSWQFLISTLHFI